MNEYLSEYPVILTPLSGSITYSLPFIFFYSKNLPLSPGSSPGISPS